MVLKLPSIFQTCRSQRSALSQPTQACTASAARTPTTDAALVPDVSAAPVCEAYAASQCPNRCYICTRLDRLKICVPNNVAEKLAPMVFDCQHAHNGVGAASADEGTAAGTPLRSGGVPVPCDTFDASECQVGRKVGGRGSTREVTEGSVHACVGQRRPCPRLSRCSPPALLPSLQSHTNECEHSKRRGVMWGSASAAMILPRASVACLTPAAWAACVTRPPQQWSIM